MEWLRWGFNPYFCLDVITFDFQGYPFFVLDPPVCLLDYFGYIPSLTHTLGSCIRLSVKLFTLVNFCEFYSRTMYVYSLQVHPTHGMVWLLMLTCTFVDCAKLLLHSIDLHFPYNRQNIRYVLYVTEECIFLGRGSWSTYLLERYLAVSNCESLLELGQSVELHYKTVGVVLNIFRGFRKVQPLTKGVKPCPVAWNKNQ